MIGLVAATANGRRRAVHLAGTWEDAVFYEEKPKEALSRAWAECEGIVMFLATGAAVRLLAAHLSDKNRDPGVVCVDDAGRFAVALTGGHEGGGNALCRRVAATLGAEPVVTTASDALGLPDLGSLGRDLGFRIEDRSDLAAVSSALVSGEPVYLVSDRRYPLGPLPENVVRRKPEESGAPLILVTDRIVELVEPPRPSVVCRPSSLVVGVGCSRGVAEDEVLDLVSQTLEDAGLSVASVAALASIDVKSDEAGLLEAAASLGVPLRFCTAEELAVAEVPNPSAAVEKAVGTASVAEASVVVSGASLVVEKHKSPNATVAVGRLPVRGRLSLVSLGPGDESLVPPLAREALAASEVVVGLDQYVNRVRHLLRPGTRVLTPPLGEEIERARLALEEARSGGSAALVSSGDIGVYAMASPTLELLEESDDIDVTVIPGVTAAQAAASLLGSPLGHDHCAISLSDLLTPWEIILSRVQTAAEGDFVVSLYNPRSRGRDWQLGKVRETLLQHRSPDTPVGLVTDAYRPTQKVVVTDLGSLRVEDVDMLTVVIVGSSRTIVRGGRLVTPRGYLG